MKNIRTRIKESGGVKSYILITLLRLSGWLAKTKIRRIIGLPVRLFYRLLSRNIMHVEIWDTMELGQGLKLWHGAHGSVINPYTRIGINFSLRQNTTIGSSSFNDDTLCPVIGNNVEVGPNCTILGQIQIGDNVKIGGGSVVVKDVPEGAVVAGNPAKIIKMNV